MSPRAYRYIFFRLMRLFNRDQYSHVSAVGFLSLIAVFNLCSLLMLAGLVTGSKFVPSGELEGLVMVVAFFAVHYAMLVRNDKYLSIIDEFQDENSKLLRIWFVVYSLGSMLLFFGIIFSGRS